MRTKVVQNLLEINKRLRAEINKKEQELSVATLRVSELAEENRRCIAENQKLKGERDNLAVENQKLRKELETLRVRLEELKVTPAPPPTWKSKSEEITGESIAEALHYEKVLRKSLGESVG